MLVLGVSQSGADPRDRRGTGAATRRRRPHRRSHRRSDEPPGGRGRGGGRPQRLARNARCPPPRQSRHHARLHLCGRRPGRPLLVIAGRPRRAPRGRPPRSSPTTAQRQRSPCRSTEPATWLPLHAATCSRSHRVRAEDTRDNRHSWPTAGQQPTYAMVPVAAIGPDVPILSLRVAGPGGARRPQPGSRACSPRCPNIPYDRRRGRRSSPPRSHTPSRSQASQPSSEASNSRSPFPPDSESIPTRPLGLHKVTQT